MKTASKTSVNQNVENHEFHFKSFLILDCWDNFEYFKLNPRGKELKPQIPLPVRLFGVRLEKIEKAIEFGLTETAEKETQKLRVQICTLPQNSVVIMEAKHELEWLEDENFWSHLTEDKIEFLNRVVKPLFRTVCESDFKAMCFEKDIVEVSLEWMKCDNSPSPKPLPKDDVITAKYETLKESIIEELGELPLSVNVVAKEEQLIRTAQTNHFWATISENKFDELIGKISLLKKPNYWPKNCTTSILILRSIYSGGFITIVKPFLFNSSNIFWASKFYIHFPKLFPAHSTILLQIIPISPAGNCSF